MHRPIPSELLVPVLVEKSASLGCIVIIIIIINIKIVNNNIDYVLIDKIITGNSFEMIWREGLWQCWKMNHDYDKVGGVGDICSES